MEKIIGYKEMLFNIQKVEEDVEKYMGHKMPDYKHFHIN